MSLTSVESCVVKSGVVLIYLKSILKLEAIVTPSHSSPSSTRHSSSMSPDSLPLMSDPLTIPPGSGPMHKLHNLQIKNKKSYNVIFWIFFLILSVIVEVYL